MTTFTPCDTCPSATACDRWGYCNAEAMRDGKATTFTREDFEHAARAAGWHVEFKPNGIPYLPNGEDGGYGFERWNPPDIDGDALRLLSAINLSLAFIPDPDGFGAVMIGDPFVDEEMPRTYERYGSHSEKPAAVRRAIFRAAIAIGNAMLAPELRPNSDALASSPRVEASEQQTHSLLI